MSANPELDPYTAKAENHDVTTQVKIRDLRELVDGVRTAMLTTRSPEGHLHSRAMSLARADEDKHTDTLSFVFIANNVSGKFGEIRNDDHVNVSFYEQATTSWVSIAGYARIIKDKNFIKKYWSTMIAGYFGDLGDGVHNGDINDPRVCAIEVIPSEIKHWIATKGRVGRTVQQTVGAVTGKATVPGELRTITSAEVDLVRKLNKV